MMLPIMLAKKILELDESEIIEVLQQIQQNDVDLYNILVEKIEDL